MLIKIALNGARPKEKNKFIPKSLFEIEKEVKLLYENGNKVFTSIVMMKTEMKA